MDHNFKRLLHEVQGLHNPWEISNRNKVTPYSHFLPHFSHQPLQKPSLPHAKKFCASKVIFSSQTPRSLLARGCFPGETLSSKFCMATPWGKFRLEKVLELIQYREKLAKTTRIYPGHMETPNSCDGNKVQQEIPTGMTVQVPQTKIPSGKEPLNSQTAMAKPLGFPTKQDIGSFRKIKGWGCHR